PQPLPLRLGQGVEDLPGALARALHLLRPLRPTEQHGVGVLQRHRGVPALLTPVVGDGAAGDGVEPGADALGAAVLGQPAGGLEEDLAGEVLGGLAVADLGVDEAVDPGRILPKGAAERSILGYGIYGSPSIHRSPPSWR